MGDTVNFLDQFGRAQVTAPIHRQYEVTKPPFKIPSQAIAPRDRYRVPRGRDEVYDISEHDNQYGAGTQFDSFDHELTRQPYDDRQRQAARGERRLSFAPNRTKFFGGEMSHQALPQSSYQNQWHGQCNDGSRPEYYDEPIGDLSRFKYDVSLPREPSSDLQLGSLSSPAFKAGQRRADNYQAHSSHREIEYQTPEPSHILDLAHTHSKFSSNLVSSRFNLSHTPPVVQGIPLVFVTELPDRIRAVFPFPAFNAVQSKCFERIYNSDENFVLAAPTGSGKTAILELAMCRAFANNPAGQYKIIYQAPIKALCSERQRDWQKRFSLLGLNCVELTGDSDSANLKHVQTADIIVTTPEKWDSITRKWKDHEKLMRLIKLFLIDEVHILKEDRGAILEAVVSRMKTIGTDVRFVALSATVPNLEDVATWLGRSAAAPQALAHSERFGEEFRPVKLKKHVCGYAGENNDFQFERFLNDKLPEVISKYSERKPIMIFCFTRNSTVGTAKMLTSWCSSSSSNNRYWKQPSKPITIQNQDLKACVARGVAFHHAGLDVNDRLAIENGFLTGDISVICCTSTLALGVNLPCQFVIIKNTVTWSDSGTQEYSDLEIMQMIGRAGRPQFDSTAIAVIMTRQSKVRRYETMVTGQEVLESKLHLGLIEHLNAEVVLGTIRDLASARRWLSGTFLSVRIKQNPIYYQLKGARSDQDVDEQLNDICLRDLGLLQESNLIQGEQYFQSSDFGDAMARYYIKYDTMHTIVDLRPKAQISEILSALSQAAEFKEIRFRQGEKSLYKTLNSSPFIRFPIPVSLSLPAHKVSILIQSVLGGVDIVWDKDIAKHKAQYQNEVATVFRHVLRFIRCIIDCQISLRDSVAIQHALLVQRSLSAKAWDDSPNQMRQLPDIGTVASKKFANAGIRSIEELELTESHRIEMILRRNPPFGLKLLEKLKGFPKLHISAQVIPNTTMAIEDDGVKVQLKVELGFLNEKPPNEWQAKLVYVCVLVATSDGRMVHFARISGKRLGNGQQLNVSALLTDSDQFINCYVMCDEIAGTMREACVKPKISPSLFAAPKAPDSVSAITQTERPTSNMSKRRSESIVETSNPNPGSDEFGDDGLDDDDLVQATSFDYLDFDQIENYADPVDNSTSINSAKKTAKKLPAKKEQDSAPKQLENGKWACNHKCKDKASCRHLCCKDGVDKQPRKPTKKAIPAKVTASPSSLETSARIEKKSQSKLQLSTLKRNSSGEVEVLDLTQQDKRQRLAFPKNGPKEYRDLHQLHNKVQKKKPPAYISSVTHKKPAYCYSVGGKHNLSFMDNGSVEEQHETVYEDCSDLESDKMSFNFEEFNTYNDHREREAGPSDTHPEDRSDGQNNSFPGRRSDTFGDDDSLLKEAMVGLADSQDLQIGNRSDGAPRTLEESFGDDFGDDCGDGLGDDDVSFDYLPATSKKSTIIQPPESPSPPTAKCPGPQTTTTDFGPFLPTDYGGFTPLQSMSHRPVSQEPKKVNANPQQPMDAGPKKLAAESENKENARTKFVIADVPEEPKMVEEQVIPDAFKDLEPWLFAEFGDIIELVEN